MYPQHMPPMDKSNLQATLPQLHVKLILVLQTKLLTWVLSVQVHSME
ncbi:hypothetical protein XBP1_400028 [Xenorhabdus bovienii str. puntauvense]|uniref:Uncharacterized protein n=1 Tax=Xenorhabdus bovienii str. puntauvense TaxID=1398201 RepID=A0A077NIS4_XENBV|nr:hypothetical protein XBFFR1_630025 [Xenorhabdus bovienii str. feltiae France]CDG91279.1 hypothetical protein XBFFL1_1440017 [Xenorhabdus bovienii str. feltiae Florida]CDG98634.1 hypothetical protein XBP1_400028 [Xenorhabdus bovienii str. puntauvense]